MLSENELCPQCGGKMSAYVEWRVIEFGKQLAEVHRVVVCEKCAYPRGSFHGLLPVEKAGLVKNG